MGVQEISGHDWHNSSINSHVYWIALAPSPLSSSRFFPRLFVRRFPTRSFSVSRSSAPFSLWFSRLLPLSLLFTTSLCLFQSFRLSPGVSLLGSRLFRHGSFIFPASPPAVDPSVVNPELVTSWTREIPKPRLLIRQLLSCTTDWRRERPRIQLDASFR